MRAVTFTRACEGSATLDLLQRVKYVDPLYDASVLPMVACATRVNEAFFNNMQGTLRRHHEAWYDAMSRLYRAVQNEEDGWANIRGLVSACKVTMIRIGWFPSWTVAIAFQLSVPGWQRVVSVELMHSQRPA